MNKIKFIKSAMGCLVSSVIVIISCSDRAVAGVKIMNEINKSGIESKMTNQFVFGELQLRRSRGSKKKGVNKGVACDCNYCFGICANSGVEDFEPQAFASANVIIEDLGNGSAKLYVLQQPENDVTVDPTLYVDNNIHCNFAGKTVTILANAYNFSTIGGIINIGNKSYTHYGTAVILLTP